MVVSVYLTPLLQSSNDLDEVLVAEACVYYTDL